jgi:DNA-binding PadR family transcriptional regulator
MRKNMPQAEKGTKSRGHAEPLSDNEGSLVGLVLRLQPVTAYQLFKVYEQSPVTSFNTSKGSLYPLINRLKRSGLLDATAKEGRGRNPEELRCTAAGETALKAWIKGLSIAHVVLDDPLRTMILSLDSLTRDEQIEWVTEAKSLVRAKIEAVEAYSRTVSVPFQDVVHKSAIDALEAKMRYLDELLYRVVKGSAVAD